MIFGIDVASILLGGIVRRHGAVHRVGRPVGHDGPDGLRQSRPRRLRHARRLRHRAVDERTRRSASSPALAIGFVVTAAVSVVFERLLYRPALSRRASSTRCCSPSAWCSSSSPRSRSSSARKSSRSRLPAALRGQIDLGFTKYRTYSIFLIVVGVRDRARRSGSASSARASARRSAPPSTTGAWPSRSASTSTGCSPSRSPSAAAWPALGGGLGAEFLGLDPQYALKYLVYFLIAVSVGGLGSVVGVFYASLLIGVLDFVLKLYLPEGRHHVHLRAHHPAAAVAAAGPVREEGDVSTTDTLVPIARPSDRGASNPAARDADRPPPPALVGARCPGCWRSRSISLFPNYLGFGTELLIAVLFALSLDLALGYAGIVTLGHAAFFGAGAYTVGLLAFHGIWNEPITSLMLAAAAAAVVGLASGLVLLRTQGLTLLMLTLCTMALLEEGANMGHDFTGGFDGLPSLPIPPLLGLFEFNPLYANTQYLYSLVVLFVVLRVRAHAGLFAVRPEPDRHPREHAAHARGRLAGAMAAGRLLHDLGGDRRHRRRPVGADQRLRQPERSSGSIAPRPCSSFSFSAAMAGSTAPSSAPSPTWCSRTSSRRSIRPPGSSASACCSSSSRCLRATASSASATALFAPPRRTRRPAS